jgi:hypothetical protein
VRLINISGVLVGSVWRVAARTSGACALVENARRIGDWRYMSQIKSTGPATNLCGYQSAQAEFTHLRAPN